MADQNSKLLDLDEIWYSEVCGSLIMNPSLKFRNSKWRIQYGGKKYKKCLDLDETQYSENSTFKNGKWRIQYGVKKYKRWLDSEKNRFLRSPFLNQNSSQK